MVRGLCVTARWVRRRRGGAATPLLLQYAALVAVLALFVPVLLVLHSGAAEIAAESRVMARRLADRGRVAGAVQDMARAVTMPPRCQNPAGSDVSADDCVRFESAVAPPALWFQADLPHRDAAGGGRGRFLEQDVCFVTFAARAGLVTFEPLGGAWQDDQVYELRCLVWEYPVNLDDPLVCAALGDLGCRPSYGYADSSSARDRPGRLSLVTYPAKPDQLDDRFDVIHPVFLSANQSGGTQAQIETLNFNGVAAFRAFYLSAAGDWLDPCLTGFLASGPQPAALGESEAVLGDPEAVLGDPVEGTVCGTTLHSTAESPSEGESLSRVLLYVCPTETRRDWRSGTEASPCVTALKANHAKADPADLDDALDGEASNVWRFEMVF